MKKLLNIIILLSVFTACAKDDQTVQDLAEDTSEPEETLSGATTAKNGVCQSTNTTDFAQRLVNLKTNWYYTWGAEPSPDVTGVEFVPMLWGSGSVTQSVCEEINRLYKEGRIFYVLGFNEPDLESQANMTVEDALDCWEYICEKLDSGIKLVSPAPSYPTRQWLTDFMAGVSERGLRCDYVAVHMYAGIGTSNYQSVIKEVADSFGKKVWVTEFAPRDDYADANGYNSYSEELVLEQMQTLLPAYESMSEVFRYSWFGCASDSMLGLSSSRFFDSSGTMTALGEYYASISPNPNIQLNE